MKTFILMLLAVALTFATQAQSVTFSQSKTNPTGSVVNTGSDTMIAKAGTTFYPVMSIQPTITKVSGTVGGSMYLAGSCDGVTYFNTDTLTLTNVATQSIIWSKVNSPYVYWRLKTTGTGTMSVTTSAILSPKK